ncbi:MAG: hypothetical protein ACU0DW_07985 [Shimia sp.]
MMNRILLSVAMLIWATAAAAQDTWTGNWASSYGQLRLVQEGTRIYGDYQDLGTIEGLIDGTGRTFRGVFLYNDGRWGPVTWQRDGETLSGRWNWSTDGLPVDPNRRWTATRESRIPAPLRYASAERRGLPDQDVNYLEGPVSGWIAALQPSPDPSNLGVRDGLSPWYAGFEMRNTGRDIEIFADVIHYAGQDTAAVDIQMYAPRNAQCPEAFHPQFCADLILAASGRGFVQMQAEAVRLLATPAGQTSLFAAFRLPGAREQHILTIAEPRAEAQMSIIHPERGYDISSPAQMRPHFCEAAQCQNAVFADVRDNPGQYRGDVSAQTFRDGLDHANRMASRRNGGRPEPAPGPGPTPSALTFAILDETSENLGSISFTRAGRGVSADGVLRGFFTGRDDHETVFRLISETAGALRFELTTYAGESGEQMSGSLLISDPFGNGAVPRGTLIVGGEVFLVDLVAAIPGLDPSDFGETPVIGIYATNYRLRDVPAGQAVRLRAGPSRAEPVTGTLPGATAALSMLQCAPDISAQAFSTATENGKLSMLSRGWCQVTTGQLAGWVPGRLLEPDQ